MVARQMVRLKDVVGSLLYNHKKLHLIEAGKIVLQDVRDARRAGTDAGPPAGPQGSGGWPPALAVVTSAKFFAPRILGHFMPQHSAIEPFFSVTQRDVRLQRMCDNVDDFYIFSVPPEGADLTVEPFMPKELVAIAAHRRKSA